MIQGFVWCVDICVNRRLSKMFEIRAEMTRAFIECGYSY